MGYIRCKRCGKIIAGSLLIRVVKCNLGGIWIWEKV